MSKEYIDKDEFISKEAIRNALYEADAITMNGVAIINQFPAADVKPVVMGEWKQTGDHSAICTTCGKTSFVGGVDRTGQALIHKGLFQFCPNCGADMREEDKQ